MITTMIDEVDGVRFYTNIKILEPDYRKFGVGLHWVSDRLIDNEPEVLRYLKAVGLRETEYDISMRAFGYAQYPLHYLHFKVVEFLFKRYWWCIRWLYDNARVFKQIPPNETFSWKYFTLYCWYKRLRKR